MWNLVSVCLFRIQANEVRPTLGAVGHPLGAADHPFQKKRKYIYIHTIKLAPLELNF